MANSNSTKQSRCTVPFIARIIRSEPYLRTIFSREQAREAAWEFIKLRMRANAHA